MGVFFFFVSATCYGKPLHKWPTLHIALTYIPDARVERERDKAHSH